MEKYILRLAEAQDYSGVETIMEQVHRLHVQWRPDIYQHTEVILPYEAFLRSIREGTFLVAEADGKIVGILDYTLRHTGSDRQVTRDVAFINSMAVHEDYRGLGIGRRFFEVMKEIVREKCLDGLELQVNARNTDAWEMYRHCGFVEKSINMELPM